MIRLACLSLLLLGLATESVKAAESADGTLTKASVLISQLEAKGVVPGDRSRLASDYHDRLRSSLNRSVCERTCGSKFVTGYDQCRSVVEKLSTPYDQTDQPQTTDRCGKAALSGLAYCQKSCSEQKQANIDPGKTPLPQD